MDDEGVEGMGREGTWMMRGWVGDVDNGRIEGMGRGHGRLEGYATYTS